MRFHVSEYKKGYDLEKSYKKTNANVFVENRIS